jgi:hypothetical protein
MSFANSLGTSCSSIAKVTDVTRRCFDRSSDLIAIFKSVFLVISTIAVSKPAGESFAQSWFSDDISVGVFHRLEAEYDS